MPTINRPNQHFDATTYTGTGATLSITNAGAFKPDFVWMKGRSNVRNNNLYDSVRGTTKELNSNNTLAETTNATGLTAFNSNGWTIGSDGGINTSSETYVGWQWKAGEGTTTVNTSGSISSNVSVNATAGFSIVTYTGTGANATVGHGLGVAPKLVIVKSRNNAYGWSTYHASLGATYLLKLNTTAAATNVGVTGYWNNTAPTSTVFTVGNDAEVNLNTATFVAYCWAEVEGYSKFGSYTGNGVNGNGPFVYCGFRPKFVMFKNTNTTQNWIIMDTARDTKNKMTQWLSANDNGAEYTDSNIDVDFLSNGFKIRTSIGTELNGSGNSIIFAAFAEAPFKYSSAR
jgi:hypothetical protein